MDGYPDGVTKEKLDQLETRSKSHHRRIGGLEVQMSDVKTELARSRVRTEALEDDIVDAREVAKVAKEEATKAAGAVSERFDKLATSFRNWSLFIITVAGIITGIVKGLTS